MDGEKEGKDNSSIRDTKRYLSWPMIRVGKKIHRQEDKERQKGQDQDGTWQEKTPELGNDLVPVKI